MVFTQSSQAAFGTYLNANVFENIVNKLLALLFLSCCALSAMSQIKPSSEREKWGMFLVGNVLSQVDMRLMIHKTNKDKISFNGNASKFLVWASKSFVAAK